MEIRGEYPHELVQSRLTPRRYVQGVYIGPVDQNQLPSTGNQEKALFLYDVGYYYEGQMRNGIREGIGRLISE